MSTQQNRFEINGYIDTNKSVLENLEELGTACNTWITFDHNIGKWSIVINRAGNSVYSFDDTNIIGGINVTESSFNDMYNSVEIQFPHEDLLDQRDWVRFDVPVIDRLPNEPQNRLVMSTTLTNDPVQAEQIALVELKQSRVNKVVEFVSDYTTLGLKAGDIITISNTEYAWANKPFRIVSIAEDDDPDGNIVLSYTCLEYDPSVYNYDLSRLQRSRATGIKAKTINAEIEQSDDVDTGIDLGRLLALTGLTSLFDFGNVVDALTGVNDINMAGGSCLGAPDINTTGPSSICCQKPLTICVNGAGKSIGGCAVPINPQYDVSSYQITGVNAADITIPLTGSVSRGGCISFTGNLSAGGKTATVNFKNPSGQTIATKNVTFLSGFTVTLTRL